MIPVLTAAEMAEADAAAPEPVEELIERAGIAVARAALDLLGQAYGRRAIVVAGKGNNGHDGRAAAQRLSRRGVRVQVVEAASVPASLPDADLVIDAAYGTGFHGNYDGPDPGRAVVLAVDVPSGVDADTGEAGEGAVLADVTVTFAALKPGLLLGAGPTHAGVIDLAGIGIDVSGARTHLVEDADVGSWLPDRDVSANKWSAAVTVVGGSPGLHGAPALAVAAAHRAGAGNVRLAVPGGAPAGPPKPVSALGRDLPSEGWAAAALDAFARCRAAVIGPGLGLERATLVEAAAVVEAAEIPVVVDADALREPVIAAVRGRASSCIVTPHDGEFARLAGHSPGADRLGATRELARDLGAIVLLKGPATIVAAPDGRALIVTSGDQRLATGGAGDVLSGVIAAFCARGVPPFEAAAAAAHVHGRAAMLGPAEGLIAADLIELLPAGLERVRGR